MWKLKSLSVSFLAKSQLQPPSLCCLGHRRDPVLMPIPSFCFTARPSCVGIPKARVKEGGRPRRQPDTCDRSGETHTIPEFAFCLGLGGTHAGPTQQLESWWAAAALVMAQAGAGFTGWVAGLAAAHLCVAVGARPTFPHAAATWGRVVWLSALCRVKF